MRTLANTPEVVEYFDPTQTKTVFSRCHKYRGGWMPEVDSWAWARLPRDPHKRKRGGIVKYHWSGSICQYAQGREQKALDRTLNADEFRAIPSREKCCNCHVQFKEAA